jgi:hypothetical protein
MIRGTIGEEALVDKFQLKYWKETRKFWLCLKHKVDYDLTVKIT